MEIIWEKDDDRYYKTVISNLTVFIEYIGDAEKGRDLTEEEINQSDWIWAVVIGDNDFLSSNYRLYFDGAKDEAETFIKGLIDVAKYYTTQSETGT